MDRRAFSKVCSSLIAGAATLSRSGYASDSSNFPQSRLVNDAKQPINIETLAVGSSHVFHYPYVTTPCFLIRLNTTNIDRGSQSAQLADRLGNTYTWQGGIGPDNSIVAFSAICTHKMSHPAKPISHLNFRTEEKQFNNHRGEQQRQSQVIMCCSEHSIYDPAQGARVLSGPAPQPLASISLEVDERGDITATGSYGGDMYKVFLEKFGFRLAMEAGVSNAKTFVSETTQAILADIYSRQQIKC